MNARIATAICTVIIALSAAPAGAADGNHATLPAIAVSGNPRLTVDCSHERLPMRDAVAAVLGTNNGYAIQHGRETIVLEAHRECRRGARRVVFVRDAASTAKAPMLAYTAG